MEKLCSRNGRANKLSTLAQAADCLAKAAVTLSEAARAAAESLSSELIDITSALDSLSEGKHGRGVNENEDEECTNPEDTDYYLSDNDSNPKGRTETPPVQPETNNSHHEFVESCSAGPMTIDQLRFDPNRPPPVASVTSEVETVAGLPYRLLVEHEADVLLFVCALIQHRRKVICYMNCSIPTFHMYKKFINDVTATNVYTITKITTVEITEVGQKFLEADRSILLLPEITTPSIEIDEIDSWVIHVGWPSDEQRYGEQRLIHQAQNSILVACSEDEELYPAGAAVMWQTLPWPGDIQSFRVSVALLRPTYDQKLASLPAEMKAKVYPDWISCHGPRGHRHVKSWDATTLVKRANSFLLDVLKYQPPESEYPGSDLHACLPEVSEGFMAHNGLESAARDGVLRVKVPGSGLNHVSSLPNPDWTTETIYTDWAAEPDNTEWESGLPSTFTPTSQLDSNTLDTTQQDSTNNAQMASTYAWVAQYPSGPGNRGAAVSNPGRDAFKTTPGFTYFMIDEEFEAIPLMCFLATTCVTIKKAVLFFRIAGCQTQYKRLIERITGWRVFVRESTESEQPSEEGVSNFVQFSEPAILLLNFRTRVLPSALHNVPLGFCVHWASTLGGQTTPRQVKRHQDCLMSQSTSIILTSERATRSATALADCDFKEHPSSVDLLYQYDSPWLSDMRAAIRSVLSGDLKFVQELYEAHLRNLRKNSSTLSTEEIASRINKFTANVLLRGEVEDGSTKYPPIAGRLATPASIIEELNLQFAVDAGMLYVS